MCHEYIPPVPTCRLQDLSADIDMIPDTQCSNGPHPLTSTQLPSCKYPHRSELPVPSCEEELLPELPIQNGDARHWKEINGGLPLSVAGGDDEHKMDWKNDKRQMKNSPTLASDQEEYHMEVGESPIAELWVARRGRDAEMKNDDSDYGSVAETVFSSHAKSSLFCEEQPLQKDMGG